MTESQRHLNFNKRLLQFYCEDGAGQSHVLIDALLLTARVKGQSIVYRFLVAQAEFFRIVPVMLSARSAITEGTWAAELEFLDVYRLQFKTSKSV